MGVLGTRAAANPARFRLLGNRKSRFEPQCLPGKSTYPACARYKFAQARCAACITVGIAGGGGALTAFAPGADVPAFLRRGLLQALGGQSDSASDALTLRNQGAGIPLKVSQMRQYVLSVVALDDGSPRLGRGRK